MQRTDEALSTDGVMVEERTAAREHRCAACGGTIGRGQSYDRVSYAPRAPINPTPGEWSTRAVHQNAACPPRATVVAEYGGTQIVACGPVADLSDEEVPSYPGEPLPGDGVSAWLA